MTGTYPTIYGFGTPATQPGQTLYQPQGLPDPTAQLTAMDRSSSLGTSMGQAQATPAKSSGGSLGGLLGGGEGGATTASSAVGASGSFGSILDALFNGSKIGKILGFMV